MNADDALRFDTGMYEAASDLVKTAPIELTEAHFDQLAIISTRQETAAREAKRQAQLAIVTKSNSHNRANSPPATKAAPAGIKDWVNKDGTRTVTYKKLDLCVDVVFTVLKEALSKERDRIGALEQANEELRSRVLELEAQAAAKVDA